MVITKLQGGLGNQIFQWAAGKSLSLDMKLPCFYDDQFYFRSSNNTQRTLDITKLPNIDELYMIGPVSTKHFFLIKDNFYHDSFLSRINFVKNSNKAGNIFLDGYWQSEKYFIKNKNEILNQLLPDDELKDKINKLFPFVEHEETVSVHVRRTDYLTSNGFHPTMDDNYYRNALEFCGAKKMKKLIFSDDIGWCRDNLRYDDCIYIEGNSNIIDLYLMSFCSHNIIANSSFSWWGAYLNLNKNKKIVAPRIWFGLHSNVHTNDIVPENWTII
jgi:hypothetical protein